MREHAVPCAGAVAGLERCRPARDARRLGAAVDVGPGSPRAFCALDLNNALRSRLSYAQSTILEREAPTHFVVPSGSRIPIDYLDGEVPTLVGAPSGDVRSARDAERRERPRAACC